MMAWAASNVVIQTVAGILGAHGAAVAAHEHRFGFLGHTVAGAVGGALSGYFLQTLAITMVTAGGSINEPTAVENAVLQSLTGLVVGACCMMSVALVRIGVRVDRKAEPDD
jgi:uncharacterized membrane protein YeaQ/YmgE (transglycosylase-associated protein family)